MRDKYLDALDELYRWELAEEARKQIQQSAPSLPENPLEYLAMEQAQRQNALLSRVFKQHGSV
jgi:hypothetical protein